MLTKGVGNIPIILGGAGCVLPTIAGLQLWLKADAGTYQDAAMTVPAVLDTDPIGGWQDQSGNGNHVTQVMAGKKPLLKLNQQNTLPAVRFDGVDDYINVTMTTGTAVTVFQVIAQRRPFPISAVQVDAGIGTDLYVSDGFVTYTCNGYGITSNTFASSESVLGGVSPFVNDSAAIVAPPANIAVNAFCLTTFVLAGINATAAGIVLGRYNIYASYYGQNDIAEALIYASALSDANRILVRDYLNCRYAIW